VPIVAPGAIYGADGYVIQVETVVPAVRSQVRSSTMLDDERRVIMQGGGGVGIYMYSR